MRVKVYDIVFDAYGDDDLQQELQAEYESVVIDVEEDIEEWMMEQYLGDEASYFTGFSVESFDWVVMEDA